MFWPQIDKKVQSSIDTNLKNHFLHEWKYFQQSCNPQLFTCALSFQFICRFNSTSKSHSKKELYFFHHFLIKLWSIFESLKSKENIAKLLPKLVYFFIPFSEEKIVKLCPLVLYFIQCHSDKRLCTTKMHDLSVPTNISFQIQKYQLIFKNWLKKVWISNCTIIWTSIPTRFNKMWVSKMYLVLTLYFLWSIQKCLIKLSWVIPLRFLISCLD